MLDLHLDKLVGFMQIVLATNIAETAVTIDDIVCVMNSGRMKEKSYDPYTVRALPTDSSCLTHFSLESLQLIHGAVCCRLSLKLPEKYKIVTPLFLEANAKPYCIYRVPDLKKQSNPCARLSRL